MQQEQAGGGAGGGGGGRHQLRGGPGLPPPQPLLRGHRQHSQHCQHSQPGGNHTPRGERGQSLRTLGLKIGLNITAKQNTMDAGIFIYLCVCIYLSIYLDFISLKNIRLEIHKVSKVCR